MGVHTLQTVILNKGAATTVSLKDEAEKWRLKGGQPVLVLDALNIICTFAFTGSGDQNSDTVCNGEYKQVAQNVKDFIKHFKDISIVLEFFFDGPADQSTRTSWLDRRQKNLYKNSEVLNRVGNVPLLNLGGDVFPCMIHPVVKEAVREMNCKVIRGSGGRDKELAKHVVDNRYLGIMSDDSDFVVFEGVPHVFSARRVRLSDMTTVEYSREIFLRAAQLESSAFPILATLMGNDFIEQGERFSDSLVMLAKSIDKKQANKEEKARALSREIFGSTAFWKTTYNSLCSYDLNLPASESTDASEGQVEPTSPEWNRIVNECLRKFHKGDVDNQTLSIVKRQLVTQSEKFEEPGDSHVDVLKGLRQRIYSILLKEKRSPGGNEVKEVMTGGVNSLIECRVQTVNIEVQHPGLLALWSDGKDMDQGRWGLIWWALRSSVEHPLNIIISRLKLGKFQTLSDHLMITGLSLLYLQKVVQKISEEEVKVLMVLATSIPELDAEKLRKKRATNTTKRTITLSTLYMQTYTYVRWIMEVCGFKVSAKWVDVYSGQLFHYLSEKSRKGVDPTKFFGISGEKARENYNKLIQVYKSTENPSEESLSASPLTQRPNLPSVLAQQPNSASVPAERPISLSPPVQQLNPPRILTQPQTPPGISGSGGNGERGARRGRGTWSPGARSNRRDKWRKEQKRMREDNFMQGRGIQESSRQNQGRWNHAPRGGNKRRNRGHSRGKNQRR